MKKKYKKKLTGGKILIDCLYKEGVKVIFGLPGVQMYHAIIPILDYKNMKFISTRHEQATTYMADGYARAGGGIGVAMVVPGLNVLLSVIGLPSLTGISRIVPEI